MYDKQRNGHLQPEVLKQSRTNWEQSLATTRRFAQEVIPKTVSQEFPAIQQVDFESVLKQFQTLATQPAGDIHGLQAQVWYLHSLEKQFYNFKVTEHTNLTSPSGLSEGQIYSLLSEPSSPKESLEAELVQLQQAKAQLQEAFQTESSQLSSILEPLESSLQTLKNAQLRTVLESMSTEFNQLKGSENIRLLARELQEKLINSLVKPLLEKEKTEGFIDEHDVEMLLQELQTPGKLNVSKVKSMLRSETRATVDALAPDLVEKQLQEIVETVLSYLLSEFVSEAKLSDFELEDALGRRNRDQLLPSLPQNSLREIVYQGDHVATVAVMKELFSEFAFGIELTQLLQERLKDELLSYVCSTSDNTQVEFISVLELVPDADTAAAVMIMANDQRLSEKKRFRIKAAVKALGENVTLSVPEPQLDALCLQVLSSDTLPRELKDRAFNTLSLESLMQSAKVKERLQPDFVTQITTFISSDATGYGLAEDQVHVFKREIKNAVLDSMTALGSSKARTEPVSYLLTQLLEQKLQSSPVLLSNEFWTLLGKGKLSKEKVIWCETELGNHQALSENNGLRKWLFVDFSDTYLSEEGLRTLNQVVESFGPGWESVRILYLIAHEVIDSSVVQTQGPRYKEFSPQTQEVVIQGAHNAFKDETYFDQIAQIDVFFKDKPQIREDLCQYLVSVGWDIGFSLIDRAKIAAEAVPHCIDSASSHLVLELVTSSWQVLSTPEEAAFLDNYFQEGKPEHNLQIYFSFLKSKKIDISQRPRFFEVIASIDRYSPRILQNRRFLTLFASEFGTIATYSPEKIKKYLELFTRLDESPVPEVQRLKDVLLRELMRSGAGSEELRKIEDIFLYSSLSAVTRFKVFDEITSDTSIVSDLASDQMSPLLKEVGEGRFREFILSELLRIQVKSGNKELRRFLTSLQNLNETSPESLESDPTLRNLGYFLEAHPRLKKEMSAAEGSLYQKLRTVLKCSDGESIAQGFEKTVLRELGFSSINEVFLDMDSSVQAKHQRSLEFAARTRQTGFTLQAGDLIKGASATIVRSVASDGFLAREYLGAAAGSDSTPHDTDVAIVTESDAPLGRKNKEILQRSLAAGYGDLLFVVTDKDRFIQDSVPPADFFQQKKSHLFKSGALGDDHYGITVGFSLVDVECIIAKQVITSGPGKLEALIFELATLPYYLPVVDESGVLIFTPEMYDEYQEKFNQLTQFDFSELQEDTVAITPQALLEKLEQSSFLKELFYSKVSIEESMTLHNHTLAVLENFENFFSSFSSEVVSKNLFKLLLAIHDVGKPLGINLEGTSGVQHQYTEILSNVLLENAGLSSKQVELLISVISRDLIGEYIRGISSYESTVATVEQQSARLQVEPQQYIYLMVCYFMCDAGAYTSLAGNQLIPDELFVVDRENNTLALNEALTKKISRLYTHFEVQ